MEVILQKCIERWIGRVCEVPVIGDDVMLKWPWGGGGGGQELIGGVYSIIKARVHWAGVKKEVDWNCVEGKCRRRLEIETVGFGGGGGVKTKAIFLKITGSKNNKQIQQLLRIWICQDPNCYA